MKDRSFEFSPTNAGLPASGSESPASSIQGDDFLANMLDRNLQVNASGHFLKPRLRSRFEPDAIPEAAMEADFHAETSITSPPILPSVSLLDELIRTKNSTLRQSLQSLSDHPGSAPWALNPLEQTSLPGTQSLQDGSLPVSPVSILSELTQYDDWQNPQSLDAVLSAQEHGQSLGEYQQNARIAPGPIQPETGFSDMNSEATEASRQELAAGKIQVPPDPGFMQPVSELRERMNLPPENRPIQVTIGRVEVRFITPAASARTKPGSEPGMQGLEEYLRRGGNR